MARLEFEGQGHGWPLRWAQVAKESTAKSVWFIIELHERFQGDEPGACPLIIGREKIFYRATLFFLTRV